MLNDFALIFQARSGPGPIVFESLGPSWCPLGRIVQGVWGGRLKGPGGSGGRTPPPPTFAKVSGGQGVGPHNYHPPTTQGKAFKTKMPKRLVFSTFCACTQFALAEPVGAEPGFVFCDFRLPAEIAKNKTNILIAHQ